MHARRPSGLPTRLRPSVLSRPMHIDILCYPEKNCVMGIRKHTSEHICETHVPSHCNDAPRTRDPVRLVFHRELGHALVGTERLDRGPFRDEDRPF